jgi:hypothetical protein
MGSSGHSETGRPIELPPVDEVFKTGQSRPEDLLLLLDFIRRFPRYSPLNSFLLYTQNPSATRVATAATWVKQFNRRPVPRARPLIILAPMSPVMFVYDVAETEGDPVQDKVLKPAAPQSGWHNRVYEHTIANGLFHGIAVREIPPHDRGSASVMPLTGSLRETYRGLDISPAASYLILVDQHASIGGRYAALVHDLARIFCGHLGIDSRAWWTDRRGGSMVGESIETESVLYLVCGRKGLEPDVPKMLAPSAVGNRECPHLSLNAILQVTGYIEDMGKSLWKGPKKKSRYS